MGLTIDVWAQVIIFDRLYDSTLLYIRTSGALIYRNYYYIFQQLFEFNRNFDYYEKRNSREDRA